MIKSLLSRIFLTNLSRRALLLNFADTLLASQHAKRKTIMIRDMTFVTNFYIRHNVRSMSTNVNRAFVSDWISESKTLANEKQKQQTQRVVACAQRAKQLQQLTIRNDDDDEFDQDEQNVDSNVTNNEENDQAEKIETRNEQEEAKKKTKKEKEEKKKWRRSEREKLNRKVNVM